MSKEEIQVGTIRQMQDGNFEGRLQRIYEGHSRDELWRMLTESASMAQWLAPGTVELRQGGAVKIDFEDSGTTIASQVLEFDLQHRLAYSWSSGDEPQRLLCWELDEVENGTKLSLTVGVPANENAAKACAGFEGHLEMLAGALEGVPMKFPLELFLQARAAYSKQLGK